jgi:hypothetical protein
MLYFQINQNQYLILLWIRNQSCTLCVLLTITLRSHSPASALIKTAKIKFPFAVFVSSKSIKVTIPSRLSTLSSNYQSLWSYYLQFKELANYRLSVSNFSRLSENAGEKSLINSLNCKPKASSISIPVNKLCSVFTP